jgi:uncharacterized DUF497 family protein
MGLTFEWDEEKARANLKNHQVGFEEAKTVFNDPLLWTFPDLDHSDAEKRCVSIGRSSRRRTLVVIHTEREGRIRLISCRKATSHERRAYEQGDN